MVYELSIVQRAFLLFSFCSLHFAALLTWSFIKYIQSQLCLFVIFFYLDFCLYLFLLSVTQNTAGVILLRHSILSWTEQCTYSTWEHFGDCFIIIYTERLKGDFYRASLIYILHLKTFLSQESCEGQTLNEGGCMNSKLIKMCWRSRQTKPNLPQKIFNIHTLSLYMNHLFEVTLSYLFFCFWW